MTRNRECIAVNKTLHSEKKKQQKNLVIFSNVKQNWGGGARGYRWGWGMGGGRENKERPSRKKNTRRTNEQTDKRNTKTNSQRKKKKKERERKKKKSRFVKMDTYAVAFFSLLESFVSFIPRSIVQS